MSSDLARTSRWGRLAAFAVLALTIPVSFPDSVGAEADRTWKRVDELGDAELESYDPGTETPRDPKIPYLPAEPYPFEPPYTAEEMGYRSTEFPHVSRWPHGMVDVFGVVTSSGYLNQQAQVGWVMLEGRPGLEGYVDDVDGGDVYARWMLYNVFPPESFHQQQLWLPRRSDRVHRTKTELFIYAPALRRVRRLPQPRRDERFPDNAQTFDDVIGRDAWEFDWRLLGTDVLHETVRLPNTRPTITLSEAERGFVEYAAEDLKVMGDAYPFYREDGGVDCWVLEATAKEEWLPDYASPKIVWWLDRHAFYPLRMEKYDREGNLEMIEVRLAKQENPDRGEFGYASLAAVYWHVPLDLLGYSIHDAHDERTWTEKDEELLFTPEFMRRQWLVEPLKSLALIDEPAQFFLRPRLYVEKFPENRTVVVPPDLAARIEAQEEAGHLVFETEAPVEE